MTTLITGGTGNTGLTLAQLLTDAGRPTLLTSRKGEAPAPFKAVKFDWFDKSTFDNPFKADSNIDRVYIVSPPGVHPGPVAKPFIDLAISKGVKRFVLLSTSQMTAQSVSTGEIEKVLEESGVEYVVLKPTWFQDNFGTMFAYTIRESNTVLSSMGDAIVPLVSTRDVAEAAVDRLTAAELNEKELFIFGPKPLTYDEAVKQLSAVIGREITFTRLTGEQMKDNLVQVGLPEDYAAFLVSLEAGAVEGIDKKIFESTDRKKWIGKLTLLDYFKENRDLWIKV